MSKQPELHYLRVENVDQSISEYELFQLFNKYGRVDTLFTSKDPKMLFVFVSFKSEEDADKAKSKIHETKVGAQYVRVWSSPGPSKDPLVNRDRDYTRIDRHERFPVPKEVRPFKEVRDDINLYTREDYEEDKKRIKRNRNRDEKDVGRSESEKKAKYDENLHGSGHSRSKGKAAWYGHDCR